MEAAPHALLIDEPCLCAGEGCPHTVPAAESRISVMALGLVLCSYCRESRSRAAWRETKAKARARHPRLLRAWKTKAYGLWEATVRFPDGQEFTARGLSARHAESRCHYLHAQATACAQ